MTQREHGDFGAFLRDARVSRDLSQADVARHLGFASAQSVSDWERNRGSAVPVQALKRLIALYRLDANEVFEELCRYQELRLREKLEEKFFGRARKKSRA